MADNETRVRLVRYCRGGFAREMARAEGYVMARKRGCSPFLIAEKEWDALTAADPAPVREPSPKINVKEFVEKLP